MKDNNKNADKTIAVQRISARGTKEEAVSDF
jgi:hypothetical protein